MSKDPRRPSRNCDVVVVIAVDVEKRQRLTRGLIVSALARQAERGSSSRRCGLARNDLKQCHRRNAKRIYFVLFVVSDGVRMRQTFSNLRAICQAFLLRKFVGKKCLFEHAENHVWRQRCTGKLLN
jgi:hypothetical protein